MNRKYLLLSAILILAGIGLVILPERPSNKELDPKNLLLAIDDPSRFLSTDLVTERIIQKDPSLMIIDVRSKQQFDAFAIPGAINIPFDSLLNETALSYLNQDQKDKIFYSNDDVLADQAWQICKRLKRNNIYVMKGGLNYWFNTIMIDNPPKLTEDSKALDLYSFRKAARQFFKGEDLQSANQTLEVNKKEEVKVVKKVPQKSSGGGC